jgi:hypothetical protein
MSVFLVWAGLSTLTVAAHGTRQDVQRRGWSGLLFSAVLAYLNWQFRIPPPLVSFTVVAALFAGAAVTASFDRGGVRG